VARATAAWATVFRHDHSDDDYLDDGLATECGVTDGSNRSNLLNLDA